MKSFRPNWIAAAISTAICVISNSVYDSHYSDSDPIQPLWANATLLLIFITFGVANYLAIKPHSVKTAFACVALSLAGFLLFAIARAAVMAATASFLH